ncbi:glycine--tRNA ligase subunit beta [Thermosipho ferrireducens]|uniref:Glycine--tRNA ligase beta subunit n=1 Tax=Thermosipho ferrireducens TaxID=2571116 RepID=A0ABX7S724_9BACT|nr:glycine--tRNA ligase subunit beta [Thermosipho ferrireducens]QTA38397.1 glycine--tRNA ligase subunit beta [Thermosipho ferrireducens]
MAEYLFEIGVEELPSTEFENIVSQLKEKIQKLLEEEALSYDKFETFAAPRRFGFFIIGLQEKQEDKIIEKRGPSLKVAYDENNVPTKALEGFLKSNGVSLDDIEIKNNYVYIRKKVPGKTAMEIISNRLPEIIMKMNFRKPMKWGNGKYSFVRIPHWILSLYNGTPLNIEIFDIKSSDISYGHRFVKEAPVKINSVNDYINKMKELKVIPFIKERKDFVLSQIDSFENEHNLKIEKDEELIEEIVYLTEYPTIISGNFSKQYLDLPEELITVTIKHHQRSFTVYRREKITNSFVSFSDSPSGNLNIVKNGYEKVINARLEDAKYYYEKDMKLPLETFAQKLTQIVFQKDLGTLMDKVNRIKTISSHICEEIKLDFSTKKRVIRTAELCKADIASNVVYEFPELQGVMGRIYALKDKEDPSVAIGIEEHYTDYPETITGAIVAIADRLDTVVGSFIVGNIPSGSKDPFGLRKKVDTVFRIITKFNWDINLENIIGEIANLLGKEIPESLIEFLITRYELYHASTRYDIARAVRKFWKKPLHGKLIAEALNEISSREDFQHLLVGFERVHNISQKYDSYDFDGDKFLEKAEKELFNKYIEVKPKVLGAIEELNYREALQRLIELRPFIDNYFDNVFVMTKQDDLRMNRLGFLKNLDKLFMSVGDLTKIEKKLQ